MVVPTFLDSNEGKTHAEKYLAVNTCFLWSYAVRKLSMNTAIFSVLF